MKWMLVILVAAIGLIAMPLCATADEPLVNDRVSVCPVLVSAGYYDFLEFLGGEWLKEAEHPSVQPAIGMPTLAGASLSGDARLQLLQFAGLDPISSLRPWLLSNADPHLLEAQTVLPLAQPRDLRPVYMLHIPILVYDIAPQRLLVIPFLVEEASDTAEDSDGASRLVHGRRFYLVRPVDSWRKRALLDNRDQLAGFPKAEWLFEFRDDVNIGATSAGTKVHRDLFAGWARASSKNATGLDSDFLVDLLELRRGMADCFQFGAYNGPVLPKLEYWFTPQDRSAILEIDLIELEHKEVPTVDVIAEMSTWDSAHIGLFDTSYGDAVMLIFQGAAD